MLTARLSIFVSVFFLMMAIVNVIPGLFAAYRERYQMGARRTARELDKFFINIKPTQILIGATALGALLGVLTGSWVIAVAMVVGGMAAPKIILSLGKEIRSGKFEAQLM